MSESSDSDETTTIFILHYLFCHCHQSESQNLHCGVLFLIPIYEAHIELFQLVNL